MTGGWGTPRKQPPTDTQVQLTWCPNCHAEPGMPCTQPDNTGRHPVRTFHLARINRAEYPPEESNDNE